MQPLPRSAPVSGGMNLEAHHRIMAIVWEYEMFKPFISIMVPWRRIYEVNLSSNLGKLGQFFGDAIYNVTVLRALWEYRQNITADAFCVSALFLELCDVVSRLLK